MKGKKMTLKELALKIFVGMPENLYRWLGGTPGTTEEELETMFGHNADGYGFVHKAITDETAPDGCIFEDKDTNDFKFKDSDGNVHVITTLETDLANYKGVIDCRTNPNYPAADAGHLYKVSVAGKIGGASGDPVEVGDMLMCTVDGSVAGTKAAVGANWNIIQQGYKTYSTDGTFADDSDLEVPTQKAVGTFVKAKAPTLVTGTVAPVAVTPAKVGNIYIDTVANKAYRSTGTSAGNWTEIANVIVSSSDVAVAPPTTGMIYVYVSTPALGGDVTPPTVKLYVSIGTSAVGDWYRLPLASQVPSISSGAGAPGTTPGKIGDIYVDTTAETGMFYVAFGVGSSADWIGFVRYPGGDKTSSIKTG